jgi:hypothetical protein
VAPATAAGLADLRANRQADVGDPGHDAMVANLAAPRRQHAPVGDREDGDPERGVGDRHRHNGEPGYP